jgi:sortase A
MYQKKIYVKDESNDPIYKARNNKFLIKSRVLPTLLIGFVFLLLTSQVVFPLVYFKSTENTQPAEASVLGSVSGFRNFEFTELSDKDRASPLEKQPTRKSRVPETFYLTVPKLGIENALVETNSPSLNPDESLGHYTGSAIPGEVGNAFIYGHSVLPWFYNPNNYKTIFSTLEDLETGDEFVINIGNRELRYVVENKETLYPKDVNPLAEIRPRYLNESTATLMTCVPPGTKLKRLMVYGILRE